MKTAIYQIKNTINGKAYIGITANPTRRWWEHRNPPAKRNTVLIKAIKKYGADAFSFTVLHWCDTREDARELENLVVETCGSIVKGYNMCPGGGGGQIGAKRRPETVERIRQSNLGKKRTPEQIERLRQIATAKWEADPEYREKVLAAMAKARTNVNENTRIEAARIASTNRVWSAESRAKLSASTMGRKYGPEVIAKMAATKRKPVRCNETGEVFTCTHEAAEKTGVKARTIWRQCKGKIKKPRGPLTFSYVEASR